MKILIVDDKSENLYLLESLLKGNGYETISAKNGEEALSFANKEKLDLIIADILMPVMDGYTLCRECKKDERLKKIPFIFYTATYTDPRDEEFALSLGADRFILKPQEPDVFIEIVNDCIKKINVGEPQPAVISGYPEIIIMKEYNHTLIRKLEDKMQQAEEAEKELRKINANLKNEIEEHKRAEEALRNSEEKFRITFEEAAIGKCLTALDGRIILVNNAMATMLGYTKEELMNMQFIDFTHKDDIELSLDWMKKMISGKIQTYRIEKRYLHKKGNQVFAEVNIALIKDSKGGPLFFVTHLVNITDRKLAEEKITLLAHSVESVSECISITDNKDIIIFVNEAFLRTYDYTENELIGKHISIVRPDNADGTDQLINIFSETRNSGWKGEVINKKKDGTIFPVSLSTSPIRDANNKTIALIGVATDITETKRAREELIQAKEQAEKSDKLKTEFLAQMSHEIRSPMHVITSFAKILKDNFENKTFDKLLPYLDGIEISSQRIIRTIESILDMSKMQLGIYEPSWTNINLVEDIFLDLQKEFSFKAQSKGLDINFIYKPKEAMIYGDQYSISQIFINLLDNAIKYTKKGKIDISILRNQDNKINVIIEDTGIGISDEFMKNLFTPFMQEERGYTRSFEGNGLGLALAKKYCDLNGITIKVESKKGIGSKFTLTFNKN
jgi:PAS domain S-box-containing protein